MPDRMPRFSAIRDAFSNRDYAIYTAGNAVSLIGFWVQRLAVGWLAWELTRSAFWLGAVAFADLFPVVLIGPFAGVLADRVDRRRQLLVCLALTIAQAVALWALVATGAITIGLLFALTLALGITIGVQQPARLSLIPALVRPADLTAAVALNSVIFNIARLVGPATAGLIIAHAGVGPAFLFNALTYVAMLVSLLAIRPTRDQPGAHGTVFADLREAISYTARHPRIGPMMLLMIVTVLTARPVLEFLPAFADEVFRRGAGGLAMLTSAVGLGAIAGGVWLAQRRGAGLETVAIVATAGSGLILPAFALTGWFPLGVAAMVAFGVTVSLSGVAMQTQIQLEVADHMRGRVLSFWGITFRGGPAIGALVIGGVGEFTGLRGPNAAGGLLCAAFALAMYLRRRRARRRDDPGDPT